jgi:hypothetical protein
MSAHLSRLRLFQRHLRSLVWAWVWVWDWIHSHTPPRTRSPSSRHPPFTHYPFPPRSLVCGGQASPHKPRLVVSHSTCPPLSSSPHAHSFVLGTAVINTHIPHLKTFSHDACTCRRFAVMGLRVGFININDMYNNDVGKGVVYAYEAYEVK